MNPVKIIQPHMRATTHCSDFACFARTTLKVANTTNGRRVKPIAMSIGMGGMAHSLP